MQYVATKTLSEFGTVISPKIAPWRCCLKGKNAENVYCKLAASTVLLSFMFYSAKGNQRISFLSTKAQCHSRLVTAKPIFEIRNADKCKMQLAILHLAAFRMGLAVTARGQFRKNLRETIGRKPQHEMGDV